MAIGLSAIVGYVQKLSGSTTDVPPTAQVHVESLALREDEPRPSLPHDKLSRRRRDWLTTASRCLVSSTIDRERT
jgi:Asp-tRNA(Asn)/Glu-tRNA(Gln) amidotransferase C subunit